VLDTVGWVTVPDMTYNVFGGTITRHIVTLCTMDGASVISAFSAYKSLFFRRAGQPGRVDIGGCCFCDCRARWSQVLCLTHQDRKAVVRYHSFLDRTESFKVTGCGFVSFSLIRRIEFFVPVLFSDF